MLALASIIDLGPDERLRVPVLYGTASLRSDWGYLLPPGRYWLRAEVPIQQDRPGVPGQALAVPEKELTVLPHSCHDLLGSPDPCRSPSLKRLVVPVVSPPSVAAPPSKARGATMSRWRTRPHGWTDYPTSSVHSDSCSSGSSTGARGRGRQVAAVGCSLERGNADRLSDLDVAIGVKEEHFEEVLGRVRQALGDLGDLVEAYDDLMPLHFPLRRFFAQYRDRAQVDLTVGFAPVVYPPRVVVLDDPEKAVRIAGDGAVDAKADEVRLWACKAWEALANIGKYVRRSSYWEAIDQLHEARANLFRLWALAEGVPQARYGVTALIDTGARMPPGIDKSIPRDERWRCPRCCSVPC